MDLTRKMGMLAPVMRVKVIFTHKQESIWKLGFIHSIQNKHKYSYFN